ncbi:MAG: hypothetical protein HYT94_02335 [Parcubacteria group bacterium]|nr:hypothetical protein [Parcubacteria group bacterium]
MKPPIIQKELLLEIEKTFRRIWDKERKTDDLFKKAVSLREQVQTLLVQELCKPESEQNQETIAELHERLYAAEEAIDTVASLTRELQELREYFFGFLSEPREAEEK